MDSIVIDCSRVTSAPEFWELCRVTLELTAEQEPHGIEGLAAALRAMRSPQLPRWVELHGVEALPACGHGDLVRALESLSEALELERPGARLLLVRRGPPPRGRLFQHESFRSPDLRGSVLEAARYLREADDPDGRCSMLWLKPRGRPWQRFFLEVGAVFWEEWGEDDTFRDFEDLGNRMRSLDQLDGVELGDVEAARFGRAGSGLRIGLGRDGAIWLLPIDPHKPETEAWLTVAPPTAPTGTRT